MRTALVVTVKDEEDDIVPFMLSIERQTCRPDIVVIVDGGSTDDTWTYLRAWDWNNRTGSDTFVARTPCKGFFSTLKAVARGPGYGRI